MNQHHFLPWMDVDAAWILFTSMTNYAKTLLHTVNLEWDIYACTHPCRVAFFDCQHPAIAPLKHIRYAYQFDVIYVDHVCIYRKKKTQIIHKNHTYIFIIIEGIFVNLRQLHQDDTIILKPHPRICIYIGYIAYMVELKKQKKTSWCVYLSSYHDKLPQTHYYLMPPVYYALGLDIFLLRSGIIFTERKREVPINISN